MTIENFSPYPAHLNQGDQKCTTLGTINVNSEETKIVIALLKVSFVVLFPSLPFKGHLTITDRGKKLLIDWVKVYIKSNEDID